MFCTMFDLITMDYIMEHIEFTAKMHPSREPSKLEEILPMFVEIFYSILSNSEIAKYLHKVGENLIFLFTPIYFIVGFGRHSEL